MGLLKKILPGSTDDTERKKPPIPDDEGNGDYKVVERTRYKATVEYRNGDTEIFECYGIYSKDEDYVEFNISPGPYRSMYSGKAKHTYERDSYHYETLAREPELEKIATDTFVICYTITYDWDGGMFAERGEWTEEHEDIELSVIEGEATDEQISDVFAEYRESKS